MIKLRPHPEERTTSAFTRVFDARLRRAPHHEVEHLAT
jgi:hypothetical protein